MNIRVSMIFTVQPTEAMVKLISEYLICAAAYQLVPVRVMTSLKDTLVRLVVKKVLHWMQNRTPLIAIH